MKNKNIINKNKKIDGGLHVGQVLVHAKGTSVPIFLWTPQQREGVGGKTLGNLGKFEGKKQTKEKEKKKVWSAVGKRRETKQKRGSYGLRKKGFGG